MRSWFFVIMDKIKGLYIVTDGELRPDRTHLQIAEEAIKGGAKIIQLRDKKIDDESFEIIAKQILQITRKNNAIFIINDRVHIAKAIGADGIHIGQGDMPISEARKIVANMMIGLSASTLEEALEAEKLGADHIGFGPVFNTSTKLDANPTTGLELLKLVCKSVKMPVAAIGGINLSNIIDVAKTGADCACVVSAVVCADDMAEAVKELVRDFKSPVLD